MYQRKYCVYGIRISFFEMKYKLSIDDDRAWLKV